MHDYREDTSPIDMIRWIKWNTLEQIKKTKDSMVMAYQIVHKLVKIPSDQFVLTTSTRGHDLLSSISFTIKQTTTSQLFPLSHHTLELPPILSGISIYP